MSVATITQQSSDTARTDAPVVVVGYDGTPESRQAVVLAADRAGPDGTVVPVHVAPYVSSWLGTPYYERAVAAHHLAATRMLSELDELETGDATVEPDIVEGSDPATALMRVAEVRDADEIVVGSRGRGRFRSMLGSVSHELIEHADRPVVIVARGAIDDNH